MWIQQCGDECACIVSIMYICVMEWNWERDSTDKLGNKIAHTSFIMLLVL